MRLTTKRLGLVLLLPMIIFSTIFGLYPLAFAIFLSLTPFSLGPPQYTLAGFGNYMMALTDSFFSNSVTVTFLIAFGAVTIELFLGLIMAVLLNERFRGSRLVRILFLLPMMTPPIVVGIIWKTMFLPNTGPFAYVSQAIGFNYPNVLGSSLALIAVVLTDVWQNTPFVMLILLAGLQSIPPPVMEAAQVDGAPSSQVFRHITLPLIVPVLIVAVVFRLVTAVKMFDVVYVLTQGGPSFATDVISIFVQRTFVFYYELSYASAASIIFMLVAFMLAISLTKVMRWSAR